MKQVLVLAMGIVLMLQSFSHAALKKQVVEYQIDGKPYEGYLVYDDARTGPRPGVLVVHQWMGLTDYEKMRADMLAEMGYVAFALDVYGKGIRPTNTIEAGEQAGKFYGDRALFRTRLAAGLEQLTKREMVDRARVAAIGYCFGGGGVLELARSGAEIAGVVSFHGSLSTPTPEDANNIKARVLVCHGALDPHVNREAVNGFFDEMNAAGVNYQFIAYSGAVHAFTQKAAGDDPSKGAAYNADADRHSWQHMKDFFAEIFK